MPSYPENVRSPR